MESSGKSNQQQYALAQYLKGYTIPQNTSKIEAGLSALAEIHKNTNELVTQNGQKLNDALGDKDTLRTYVLALFVELGEFIQTLDWKPWRNVPDKSQEIICDEFADILAFVGVLITVLNARGISTRAIAEAYKQKEFVNVSRFIQKMEEDDEPGKNK